MLASVATVRLHHNSLGCAWVGKLINESGKNRHYCD